MASEIERVDGAVYSRAAVKRAALLAVALLNGCASSDAIEVENPLPQPKVTAATETPSRSVAVTSKKSKDLDPRLLRRFKALQVPPIKGKGDSASEAMVDLGRMLYFDKRLSVSHEVSCQSCHPLEQYGATNEAVSTGVRQQKGSRNAPTTYHAAGHISQFWDGRAANVEEQAKGPILNPVEMGMESPAAVEAMLRDIPGYCAAFELAFPKEHQPVSYENVGKAIGAFERGLVTPSRWDDYLKGDSDALTAKEKDGLRLFTNLGCMVCHTGEYVGGSMYEKLGVVEPWPNQSDKGRGGLTAHEDDEMTFKVPSLRNVAMTAPYFHDGSAKTLDHAVRMMARHQLGDELDDDEVASLVAWLSALTGPLPKEYIKVPKLPPGAAKGGK